MDEKVKEFVCPKRIIFKRCKQEKCAWWIPTAGECAVKANAIASLIMEGLEVKRAKGVAR